MADDWFLLEVSFQDDPPTGDLANQTAQQKMFSYMLNNFYGYVINNDWSPVYMASQMAWRIFIKRR
jgi:hypothetical protein